MVTPEPVIGHSFPYNSVEEPILKRVNTLT